MHLQYTYYQQITDKGKLFLSVQFYGGTPEAQGTILNYSKQTATLRLY
jgi:hypothetical protein